MRNSTRVQGEMTVQEAVVQLQGLPGLLLLDQHPVGEDQDPVVENQDPVGEGQDLLGE